MIIWLTGPSGAGKTVYAEYLRDRYDFIELDGDKMRETISSDLGFSPREKQIQGRRMIELCKLLYPQSHIVVSTITAFNGNEFSGRNMVHSALSGMNYRMVWVKASFETCRERDPKGIYKNRPKYLAGMDDIWEDPDKFDLCLDTEKNSINENCKLLDKLLIKEGWV